MLKSLLIGLDRTEASSHAESVALDLAKRHGAAISGASVIDVPFLTAPEATPIGGAYYKFAKDVALLKQAQEQSQAVLQQFEERCRTLAIRSGTTEYHGEPYGELCKAADIHDLIVIGRDVTFHRDDHAVLGDAVARLAKNLPRPLVVVPPASPRGPAVLAAYDGSLPAMRALQLYALLGLYPDAATGVVAIDRDKATAEAMADRGARFLRLHGLRAEAVGIQSGADPAEVLLSELQAYEPGLLVMGAFGHRGWREALLGSCTGTLLRRGTVPLFIYH
ncbi:universal stress protein [Inquilinus limosus]|uniref:universal stress protein n=1 Tax=Inquilinus limosus TaxID=171674 RepID=UPI0004258B97|nr:universal stress protein [Inquilinus limosus]